MNTEHEEQPQQEAQQEAQDTQQDAPQEPVESEQAPSQESSEEQAYNEFLSQVYGLDDDEAFDDAQADEAPAPEPDPEPEPEPEPEPQPQQADDSTKDELARIRQELADLKALREKPAEQDEKKPEAESKSEEKPAELPRSVKLAADKLEAKGYKREDAEAIAEAMIGAVTEDLKDRGLDPEEYQRSKQEAAREQIREKIVAEEKALSESYADDKYGYAALKARKVDMGGGKEQSVIDAAYNALVGFQNQPLETRMKTLYFFARDLAKQMDEESGQLAKQERQPPTPGAEARVKTSAMRPDTKTDGATASANNLDAVWGEILNESIVEAFGG